MINRIAHLLGRSLAAPRGNKPAREQFGPKAFNLTVLSRGREINLSLVLTTSRHWRRCSRRFPADWMVFRSGPVVVAVACGSLLDFKVDAPAESWPAWTDLVRYGKGVPR